MDDEDKEIVSKICPFMWCVCVLSLSENNHILSALYRIHHFIEPQVKVMFSHFLP